jgi:hypothetical protein
MLLHALKNNNRSVHCPSCRGVANKEIGKAPLPFLQKALLLARKSMHDSTSDEEKVQCKNDSLALLNAVMEAGGGRYTG